MKIRTGLLGPKLAGAVSAVVLAAAVICNPFATQAADDLAFEADVGAAIDDGLQYLRNQNAFTGGSGASRPLAVLALLEKRASAAPGAPLLGYVGSSAADQALARSAISLIMNDTSYGVSRASLYTYAAGGNLMALSVYATTGGPEVANTNNYTLRSAIDREVDRVIAGQTNSGQAYDGFWGYTGNGADSSTTQFAAAGLAAAKAYYLAEGDPGSRLAQINAALALTRAGYAANQNADGGEGYQAINYNSSYQQTASASYISLLGGATVNDPTMQGYLNWQKSNYNYQTIYAAYNSWTASYYYYLWSSSKAYTLIADAGIPAAGANVEPSDLGSLPNAPISLDRSDYRLANRNYVTDPDARTGANPGVYKHYEDDVQKPRWYYDYAYSLMTQQNSTTGQFTASSFYNNGQSAINHGCWNTLVCQSYAILVLERAIGGVCSDNDGDGVCDSEDNCPADPNPDQSDRDQDSVGDVCDNCPDVFNPGQEDSNGDGIGDACTAGDIGGPASCDMDGDGDIDRRDIRAITRIRGQVVNPAGGPGDFNSDGKITSRDVKECNKLLGTVFPE